MIIENPEALKAWLTIVLEPKCDADPNALAKYVIALVKKDKPLNELKDTCTDQLDVFLQQETKPFVELLFKTLESKSYLKKSEPAPVVNTPVQPAESVPPVINNVVVSPVSVPPLVPPVNTLAPAMPVANVANNNTNSNNRDVKDIREVPRRIGRTEGQIDVDDRDKRCGRRLSVSRSRSRSRSRSSRSRSRNRSRSRSRERDDRRRRYNDDKRDRRGPPRRYDRYPEYRRDGDRNRDREREVDRNREHDRPRSRSRTPRSRTRSRSRSREKERQRPEVREANHKTQSPSAAEHGDTDYRYSSQGSAPSDSSPASAPSSLPPVPGTVVNDVPPMYSFNRTKPTRRCRDFDEMGFCMRGDLCPYDHGNDPVIVEDVNLPGMMNFAAPPPSQGPSANPPLPPILGPPMNRPPLPPGPPPGAPHPPVSRNHGTSSRPESMPYFPEPYIPEPYNPEAPSLDRPPRLRPPYWGPRPNMMRGMGLRPPPPFQQHMTRELINVQTVDDTSQIDMSQALTSRTVVAPLKRSLDGLLKDENDGGNVKLQQQEEVSRSDVPNKRLRQFDFNRLGPRKNQSDNMTLELRKIPRGLNSITQLNNHFAKFGKIVNMQVCYEGNPEAALITFSSHAEANAAYRSTEAVLNNRFIKLFWHNKENAGGNVPTAGTGGAVAGGAADVPSVKQVVSGSSSLQKTSLRERLGGPVIKAVNTVAGSNSTTTGEELEKTSVVLSPTGNLSKTVFNPAALKKNNVPIVSKTQLVVAAQEAVKKKQDEQRKEVLKITANIQKRKQELVEKYIQDQKLLIEKLEKNKSMPAPEREKLLKTINSIQESIKSVKKDVVQPTGPALPKEPKTKIEAQKELLDIEMDLYNKQHQGADTTELRKKVAELKQEARALGLLDSARGRGRGRGRGLAGIGRGTLFRGRGRGNLLPSTASVDHRPRKLLISGVDDADKDDVMTHLAQFGEIESVEHNEVGHTSILSFKTRKDAELFVHAVLRGPKFKEKNLQMSWYKDRLQDQALEGTDGDIEALDEELADDVENVELLLADDDEEEDSEARSWKR